MPTNQEPTAHVGDGIETRGVHGRARDIARTTDGRRVSRYSPNCTPARFVDVGLDRRHSILVGRLVLSGSERGERVAHQGDGTFQEVCLLIHQPGELAEGLRCRPKRRRLRTERARSLIDEILCGVQRRGGPPDELALELKLTLEHLLEQFGLVLQRSHQIARRSGRTGSQLAGMSLV